MVITDVDGVLRSAGSGSLAEARPALEAAALGDTPLVLCSERSATELRALQDELDIRHPFISDGGAALHIPSGYFCGTVLDDHDGWEVLDFGVRRLGHAVRLLVALFRSCPVTPVVVGIGHAWRDRALLREVDVPVVVRDAHIDQSGLLRNIPEAYVTRASGRDGWSEAILGHCSGSRA